MPVLKWSVSAGDSPARRASLLAAAQRAARQIAELATDHRAVVQAGGHVGLWPLMLSEHFAAVYTVEPEAENWHNLVRNADRPNVFAARGVLGSAARGVQVARDVPKSGHWYAVPAGPIPTYTIDGLGVPLDAIVLDVEGAELDALIGAEQTIARDRPLIWCETQSAAHREALEAWLAPRGYRPPQQGLKRDWYWRRAA